MNGTCRALAASVLSALLLSTSACHPGESEPGAALGELTAHDGEATRALLEDDVIKLPRCSWPERTTTRARFGAARQRTLHWRVIDAEQLPVGAAAVTQAIKQALRKWSIPAGLQLEQSSAAADITIRIAHVDGVRGALSATRSDGEGALVVIDKDESWSTDYRPHTYSLHGVLLHELGHALGLGHSAATSAVMHMTAYGGYREFLTADDRDAVERIYKQR